MSHQDDLLFSKSLVSVLLITAIALFGLVAYILSVSSENGVVDGESSPPNGAVQTGGQKQCDVETFEEADAIISTESERIALIPKSTSVPGDHENPIGTARIVMRFVNGDSRPLPGVQVRFNSDGLQEQFSTKDDGRAEASFAFDHRLPLPKVHIEAVLDWYVTKVVSANIRGDGLIDLGDIVLEEAGALSGRVIDAQGQPVYGARVCCTDRPLDEMNLEEVRKRGFVGGNMLSWASSGADGSFRLCHIPPGTISIWAGNHYFLHSHSDLIGIRAGEEVFGVEIVLDPRRADERIECLVLTPEGEPDSQARIKISRRHVSGGGSHTSNVDHEGWFRYIVKEKVPHSIEAWSSTGEYEKVYVEDIQPGTLDLVIRFESLQGNLRLRVRDEKGEPLDTFTAEIVFHDAAYESDRETRSKLGFSPSRTTHRTFARKEFYREGLDSDGIAELAVPLSAFMVKIDAENYTSAEFGPYERGGFPDPLDAVLFAISGVRGKVMAGGMPVAGARVSLHKAVMPNMSYEVNRSQCRSSRRDHTFSITDQKGGFCLLLKDSGTFYIRACADRFAPGELGPLALDCVAGKETLRIDLTEGGSIEGKVIVAPDEDLGGILLSASRGDGFPIFVETDRVGSFSFHRLTPGRWLVKKCPRDWRTQTETAYSSCQSPPTIPWVCLVEEGRSTHYILDLTGEDND